MCRAKTAAKSMLIRVRIDNVKASIVGKLIVIRGALRGFDVESRAIRELVGG